MTPLYRSALICPPHSVDGRRADAQGTARRTTFPSLCMFGVPFSSKLGFGFEIPVSFPRTGDTAPLKRAGRRGRVLGPVFSEPDFSNPKASLKVKGESRKRKVRSGANRLPLHVRAQLERYLASESHKTFRRPANSLLNNCHHLFGPGATDGITRRIPRRV